MVDGRRRSPDGLTTSGGPVPTARDAPSRRTFVITDRRHGSWLRLSSQPHRDAGAALARLVLEKDREGPSPGAGHTRIARGRILEWRQAPSRTKRRRRSLCTFTAAAPSARIFTGPSTLMTLKTIHVRIVAGLLLDGLLARTEMSPRRIPLLQQCTSTRESGVSRLGCRLGAHQQLANITNRRRAKTSPLPREPPSVQRRQHHKGEEG